MATCLHPTKVREKLFPCGKCPVCRQNMRQSKGDRFTLAAAFNIKNGGSNYFVTLTYEDEHLNYCRAPNCHDGEWFPCFNKNDIKLFFHYLRRKGYGVTYFVTFEYGEEFHRPHYHAILLFEKNISLIEARLLIQDCWKYGFVQVGSLNNQRVQYAAKYVLKDDPHYMSLPGQHKWDYRKPTTLISNGFGSNAIPYLNEYIWNDGNIRDTFEFQGKRVTFDSFIKNHIDPSLKAELQVKYYEKEKDIQEKLYKSRLSHSKEVVDDITGKTYFKKDFTKDLAIFRHRLELKKLKKNKCK